MSSYKSDSPEYLLQYLPLAGKWMAALSFAAGSLILGLFLTHPISDIVILGFYYLVLAVSGNTIMAIVLLATAVFYPPYRSASLTTILIMLVNVPVAITYFMIVINS